MRNIFGIAAAAFLVMAGTAQAQQREKIIIDTDIGDDIDDAFAAALALSSPDFEVLGVSAGFGDTVTRARMLDRLLGETGPQRHSRGDGRAGRCEPNAFTQRRYAEGGTSRGAPIPTPWISSWTRRANIPARSPWLPSGRCPISGR